MTKELVIDGSAIRTVGDFGNALVAIINPQAIEDGWIEDNLNSINDDLREIQALGYSAVVIKDSEAMRSNLASHDSRHEVFDTIVDMFSDKAIQLRLH